MRIKRQAEQLTQEGKARAAAIIEQARRECWSQARMLEALTANIRQLPELPRHIRRDVVLFGEGYQQAVIRASTASMYFVDGALYRLTNETAPELASFPTWEAIGRENYSAKLTTDSCGLYWINGGNPRPFFTR